MVLLFLLGSGTAWAAQREAEFWIFSASLSQAFTDNLLLVRGDGPGELGSSHAQIIKERRIQEACTVQIPRITGKSYRIAS